MQKNVNKNCIFVKTVNLIESRNLFKIMNFGRKKNIEMLFQIELVHTLNVFCPNVEIGEFSNFFLEKHVYSMVQ